MLFGVAAGIVAGLAAGINLARRRS
jgi:hypothetical protein